MCVSNRFVKIAGESDEDLTSARIVLKMKSMGTDRVTLKIPRPLYEKIKIVIEGSGFSSVNEFVVYILRDLLSVTGTVKKDLSSEEVDAIPAIKTYFKAYVTSDQVRHIIESRQFTDLATNAVFSTSDFRAVPKKYRKLVPEYVKDYVPLNQFVA